MEDSQEDSQDPELIIRLYEILDRQFNESELRTLCFYLKIDYDDLSGTGMADKPRELVLHCARHNRINNLRAEVEKQRPGIQGAISKGLSKEPPRLLHNLPQRFYSSFIGREAELQTLAILMQPYPHGKHFMVTVKGVGGVGKTVLALEFAWHHCETYATLPPEERFEAIVWVSAKREILTPDGIKPLTQSGKHEFRTLPDLYRAIAHVLQKGDITKAQFDAQHKLVDQVLREQRVLLIIDDLETVKDNRLLRFLRDVPAPTKIIVTTRHAILAPYELQVRAMDDSDAMMLIEAEAKAQDEKVKLIPSQRETLVDSTGGLPLAIVWSIGLMRSGCAIETVLRELRNERSPLVRFCFERSVKSIATDLREVSHRLLVALVQFNASVNREMLGEIAGLSDDPFGRDEGLMKLLRLSLIHKIQNEMQNEQIEDRFYLLQLTRQYILTTLGQETALIEDVTNRWVKCLTELASPYAVPYWLARPDRTLLQYEGRHLVTLAKWSLQTQNLDILLQILPALSLYFDIIGDWTTLETLAQIGLEYARRENKLTSEIYIITHPLRWILGARDKLDEVVANLDIAKALAEQLNNPTQICDVLRHYGLALRHRGNYDQAQQLCEQVLELVPQLPEAYQRDARSGLLYEIAKVNRDRIKRDGGDWHTVEAYLLDAFQVWGEEYATNPEAAPSFLWWLLAELGHVKYQLGAFESAERMYVKALPGTIEDTSLATKILHWLGELEVKRGNDAAALGYANRALESAKLHGQAYEQTVVKEMIDGIQARMETPGEAPHE